MIYALAGLLFINAYGARPCRQHRRARHSLAPFSSPPQFAIDTTLLPLRMLTSISTPDVDPIAEPGLIDWDAINSNRNSKPS